MSTIEMTTEEWRAASPVRAVAWPLAASILGRLPLAALGLVLLLHTRALGGSYTLAGVVAAAFGVGLAGGAPLLGRIADRRGGTPVLVGATLASVAVLAALAALPHGVPAWSLLSLAAAAGFVHPPVGGIVRSAWPRLLSAAAAQKVYAVEASVLELTYIAGPAVLGGALAARSPRLALLAAAALLLAGSGAMLLNGSLRRAGTVIDRPRGERAGALASRGVVVLSLAFAGLGASLGAVDVAVAATAGRSGDQSAAGVLLAVWGLGSLVGGAAAAYWPARDDGRRRLVALAAAAAVLHAALALLIPAGLVVLGIGLFVAGTVVAPGFATAYVLTARIVPEGTATEAFSWLSAGIAIGLAAGSALAGALVDGPGPGLAFVAGATAPLAAAGLLYLRRRDLRPPF